MLQDVVLKPLGDGKIKRAAIILHGLGDNAAGIMGLGEVFRKILPDTLFVAPDAPFACPHVPSGFQWFGSENWTPEVILKGIQTAQPLLNDYIDHVLETYKLTPDKLALIGFSQGTMMSLYTAPRRTPSLAGILGYSGALFGDEDLKNEKKSSPPVQLIHGMMDPVVPFSCMEAAKNGLKKAKIPVRSLECPGLDHGVDERGLHEGVVFLHSIFKI